MRLCRTGASSWPPRRRPASPSSRVARKSEPDETSPTSTRLADPKLLAAGHVDRSRSTHAAGRPSRCCSTGKGAVVYTDASVQTARGTHRPGGQTRRLSRGLNVRINAATPHTGLRPGPNAIITTGLASGRGLPQQAIEDQQYGRRRAVTVFGQAGTRRRHGWPCRGPELLRHPHPGCAGPPGCTAQDGTPSWVKLVAAQQARHQWPHVPAPTRRVPAMTGPSGTPGRSRARSCGPRVVVSVNEAHLGHGGDQAPRQSPPPGTRTRAAAASEKQGRAPPPAVDRRFGGLHMQAWVVPTHSNTAGRGVERDVVRCDAETRQRRVAAHVPD